MEFPSSLTVQSDCATIVRMFALPKIIQGGMGVGVSNWRLAQAVSRLGQLGVVSGTALDQVLVRRLADGDEGGAMRRAFEAFPFPQMARRIWSEFFVPGGKVTGSAYPNLGMHQRCDPRKLTELLMVSNFVEVFLARQGHLNKIGVNFLEKVQLPHLASIYGAMLAGVGYVLMGAGIPLHIPGVLDNLAAGKPAEYKFAVSGAPAEQDTMLRFDPRDFVEGELPKLDRPKFLAIVSSNTLAATMLRRASGKVDGLVVETATAGGHNAPPRGKMALDDSGQPVYGERDRVDIGDLRKLGVPFWMAGGYGSAQKLREALEQGAAGVQVGTAFAFSEESGLRHDLKKMLMAQAAQGQAKVFTDPLASPTGFPFKVAQLAGTYSDAGVAAARTRVCDLGYLREAYWTPDGQIAYRCAAEPEVSYLAKGGKIEESVGRKCLCNALLANIGHPQTRRDGVAEPPLVTVGDDVNNVAAFLHDGAESYSAADVVETLMRGVPSLSPA
jgi:nitronate monooxygenase